jgi:hypothetical protein
MFLAGDAEGVCSGVGEGVIGSAGIEAGDSSVVADGVGDGYSCARPTDAKNTKRIATFVFVVMSNRIGTSLIT